jgi:predicted ATPase/DNA-binding SARP family transcriptional activator
MVGVAVLGPLEVRGSRGMLVPITSLRQRRLLAALVWRVGAVVHAGEIVELVWGSESLPEYPAGALHTVVARMRRVLPSRFEIVTEGQGYRLVVDDLELIDTHRFCNAIDVAQRELDTSRRLPMLDEALGLIRGRPYEELDHPAVAADVTRLGELELLAHELRGQSLLELNRASEAVVGLQTLVIRAPLREGPVELLMQALVESGRQSEALRAYRRLRSDLVEQLGIEPSAELRRLEQSVLRQERASVNIAGRHIGRLGASVVRRPGQSSMGGEAGLIGRTLEVEQLVGTVAGARLVTLVGVGGAGKSRLARAVAELAGEVHAHEVAVCELATIGPGGGVAAAVATMLAVQPHAGRSIVSSVADALSSRRMLLVLDNCEHVLDGVAELVGELEARCPDVSVLATSREPLRVPGERLWPVAPLADRDSVELFRLRARSGHPRVVLPVDDGLLEELCRRLDGLPLAIELAAACVGSLTVSDLLEGVNDRFVLLDRAERRGAGRHRTLAAMVAWSHDMLGDDERGLFNRLSVFSGRFDLETAIRVGAVDDVSPNRVRAQLTSLVDKSMLSVELTGRRTRYRLLDTLRDFGLTQLAERSELEDARRRHLATFVDVAERARREYVGCANGPGHDVFVREWDNFRAAVEWALTQRDVVSANRMLRALFCFAWYDLRHELGEWAENVLALGSVDPTTAGIAAAFRAKQLDTKRAIELAGIGLAAPGPPAGDGVGLCLFAIADARWNSGDAAEAWEIARQCSDAVDDDGDSAIVTTAISEAAYTGAMYDPPASEPYIARLQRLSRHIDDPGAEYCYELATALRSLFERRQGEAELHTRRAMQIADSMNSPLHIGVAREVLAGWALRTKRDDSDSTIAGALVYLHSVQDNGEWVILESVAIRWVRAGRLAEAAVVFGHLERHGIRTSSNLRARPPALARIAGTAVCAERLRYGATLDRDQVIEFAVTALRAASEQP